MNKDVIDLVAEAIYEAMFTGYFKKSWSAASSMDQFRCREAARAALASAMAWREMMREQSAA